MQCLTQEEPTNMATVSTTLPSDGQTIDASDVNTPINAILAEFNGNIDNDNIKTGANISGSKLGAATTPLSVLDTDGKAGWITGVLAAPNTITNNGNRSYDMVFNSVDYTDEVSEGMRLRLTRTVSAPTQCADLESGSSQYFSKTSPNKLTFTDDFVVSAWVKLESYPGGEMNIVSRYNGTSGWYLDINSSGQPRLVGVNGGGANVRLVYSYQSIPLNKWVHITAQLDMSAYTTTSTTCYVMIDGVDVPAQLAQGGTNPTALIQAGNLEIGSANATEFFDGKIAQVAIFNAKVTQATMRTYMSQGLSGSETSLASAYSFSNSITDLNTTTPNDLTAQGSAVATNVDSPFGNYLGGTLEYGIITKTAFSTNTTLTVQVPEGCTIPTSGGVSAVAYSTQKVPYKFPAQRNKWTVEYLGKSAQNQSSAVNGTWYNPGSQKINAPIGDWVVNYQAAPYALESSGTVETNTTLSTANNSETDTTWTTWTYGTTLTEVMGTINRQGYITTTSATDYYLNIKAAAGNTTLGFQGSTSPTRITFELAYI